MKIGPWVRSLLPRRVEIRAAEAYRAIFVDLEKVAGRLAAELPAGARVLDIGGGDGALLNRLFALRPDLEVSMVDVAASVGRFVDAEHEAQVQRHPGTTIEEHLCAAGQRYDAALISDVLHHIDERQREGFLRHVAAGVRAGGSVLVKDVEPGHFRSWLGWLCDRYLSGDRGVALISSAQVLALSERVAPGSVAAEVGLLAADRPNYLVSIRLPS